MSKARTYGRCGAYKIPEDKTLCVENVSDGMQFATFYQCQKKRGHGPRGEYCRIHDPAAVEARQKARHERMMAPLRRTYAMADEITALRARVAVLERHLAASRRRRP